MMTTTIEDIFARGTVPASTAYQARLMIFQPTRRPHALAQLIQTAWGKHRVKGRLGQQHADVLEAILHSGTTPRRLGDDGRIKILVDPAEVRRKSRQDGTTLQRVLDDLMQAIIEIIEPDHLAGIGHLIDHIDWARRPSGAYLTKVAPGGAVNRERRQWRVELGKMLCRLVDSDLWISRDPYPIAAMRHGISQAVARHVLSHKVSPKGGWRLDGLITSVAGSLPPQQQRNRRREIYQDVEALLSLGIMLNDGRIRLIRKDAACSKTVGPCSIPAAACSKTAGRVAKPRRC
ncbi:hypothetical protein [Acidithiobacillus sp.]